MSSLRIYRIDTKYVRYLSKVDSNVQDNKDAKRPYVGIVLTVGSYRYFVPMESPKANHKSFSSSVHIMPIDNGTRGLLGFNNMIPVPSCALITFDINDLEDKKYAALLRRQASFINKHKSEVYHRASRTYYLATSPEATEQSCFFKRICCDFKKLEQKCDRYDPNFWSKNRK